MANGLITKQSDLTSLKYSSMPLGSTAPFITKNIGQAPGSAIGLEIQARIDDTSRIAQMLVSKPGIKYLLHEAELQQFQVGQRIKKAQQQKGKTVAGAVLQQVGSTIVDTLKIAGSTLAQVAVDGTGTHFLKGFKTNTYLQPEGGNTASGFAQFFGAGGIEGAQYALRGEVVPGVHRTELLTDTRSSNFDYVGGDVFVDRNEILNKTLLPDATIGLAKINAQKGVAIPVQKGPETTATPGNNNDQNLIQSIQSTGSFTQDIIPDSITNIGEQISEGSGYYTNRALDATNAAVNNNAVPIKTVEKNGKQEPAYIQTTAKSGVKSKSNLIKSIPVSGSVAQVLAEQGVQSSTYSDVKTYNNKTSQVNINAAVTGSSISNGGTTPTDFLKETSISIQDSKDQKLIDKKSSAKSEDSKKAKNKYKKGQSYAQTKGAVTPDSEIQHIYKSIADADTAAKRSHRSQPEPGLADEYSEGSTYSDEQATRLIGESTVPTQKETRVLLGDQGKTSKASINYWTPAAENEVDGINMLDVSDRVDTAGAGRDLAKFYFEIITPEGSKFLYFRAHLKDINDNYTANWESHKYVGRAEDFYTYGGFGRDVDFSFTVAAATRNEMKPLYRKMVYLASSTAPTYGASGFMRGTLARLTIGSYLDQIPGVITSVKYSISTDVPWDIAMGQPEGVENDMQVLPMVIECSVSFKPIHDFAPQTGLHHYFTNSHEGPKFFESGEGDFSKTPITSAIAQKQADDKLNAQIAKAQADNQAKAQAAAKKAAEDALKNAYDSNLSFSAGI